MNARDFRDHARALMSLYVTGLELTNIASCGPLELQALLMPHVEEIERVMEKIRVSMQSADVALPMERAPVQYLPQA